MDTDALFKTAALSIQQNNSENSGINNTVNNTLNQLQSFRTNAIDKSLKYIANINQLNNNYYTKIATALKLPPTANIIKILSSCSAEEYAKIALLETIKEAKILVGYLFKGKATKEILANNKNYKAFSDKFMDFFKDMNSPQVQAIQAAQALWDVVRNKRSIKSSKIVELKTVLSRISHVGIGRLYEDLMDYTPQIAKTEAENTLIAVEKQTVYATQDKAAEIVEEINNRRYSTKQTTETDKKLYARESKADRMLSLLINGTEYQVALSLKSGKFVEYNSNEPRFYNRFTAGFQHTGLNIEKLVDRSSFTEVTDFTSYIEPLFNLHQPAQLYEAMLIILDIIALNKVTLDIGGTLKLPIQYVTFFNEWYRTEDVYNALLESTKKLTALSSILKRQHPTKAMVEEQMNNDSEDKFGTFAKKIKFSASVALILREQGIKVNNVNVLKERKDVV